MADPSRVAQALPPALGRRKRLPHESTSRVMQGGFAKPRDLPKGPNGRSLCRWCNLEIPKRRSTFCSDFCVNEWRLRTDPAYLRDQVFARDRGICAQCGLDTIAAWNRIRRMRSNRQPEALAKWGFRRITGRTSLWDADHIVPVVEGGGECDLSNLRTLCLKCHREATQALRLRLAGRGQAPAPVS
jgi:5-methylcytosine-specific restriction endonuclease McrA